MSVKMRIEVERKIITRAIEDALKAGFALNLDYDDGDVLSEPSADLATVLSKIMQGDDDRVYYYKDGECVGWAWFVYGNDGYDALSDYTVNLESVLVGANEVGDRYAN